jgi:carboxyl-terminal processing protease
MSNSNGCKIAFLVVIVAVFMGSLGFATGFATHAVWVAADSLESFTTIAEVTAAPPSTEVMPAPTTSVGSSEAEPSPLAPAEPTPEPTPIPTIDIPPETGETFDLFWEAWEIIQEDFYGELPTEQEMTYAAIRGATNVLDDPYTAFVEPAAAEHRRQTDGGSYEGIGALVTMEDGRLVIVEPFEGQPADIAGIRAGDIVLQVDDTPIENMSLYEAIALILGPAGTEVRLTILREGDEPFEVVVTRAEIDIPLVESEMRPDGIAYVSLFQFNSEATAKLAEAIEELLAQNPEGLILDLRGNPGGFLHEAMLTSGLFLPNDKLVMIERTKDGELQLTPEEFGSGDPIAPDIPMVVLVNGGSASASEIVAGALQDYERAVLLGEQTFGKGSVQLLHELSDGSELRVTKARWFTPNNRAIHGEGLEPDIIVELTQEDEEAELDPQLDRAVEYLLTGE